MKETKVMRNPTITLKIQAKKLDFSKLRIAKDNERTNSSETMHGDFYIMNFCYQ
ncbi:MAG: hypothetical protein ACR5KW_03610 [Wolbachia sp.]